jgi:hypothetical protein
VAPEASPHSLCGCWCGLKSRLTCANAPAERFPGAEALLRLLSAPGRAMFPLFGSVPGRSAAARSPRFRSGQVLIRWLRGNPVSCLPLQCVTGPQVPAAPVRLVRRAYSGIRHDVRGDAEWIFCAPDAGGCDLRTGDRKRHLQVPALPARGGRPVAPGALVDSGSSAICAIGRAVSRTNRTAPSGNPDRTSAVSAPSPFSLRRCLRGTKGTQDQCWVPQPGTTAS